MNDYKEIVGVGNVTLMTRVIGERIKMPKRGVNWANSKFSCNNLILRIAQLTHCALKSVSIKLTHKRLATYVLNLL